MDPGLGVLEEKPDGPDARRLSEIDALNGSARDLKLDFEGQENECDMMRSNSYCDELM